MDSPIEILFEDDALLIVSKPAGVLSVPAPGQRAPALAQRLAAQGRAAEPVHRLDREVSGCLICAKEPSVRAALEDLFRERRLRKFYWALVVGSPPRELGEFKDPILEERSRARVSARGRPAQTRYRLQREGDEVSEVLIDLVTGRYNQIRVHFAHAGMPLVGETKYARRRDDPLAAKRLALHASRLAFDHPVSGEALALEAPLPADLVELRRRAFR